MNNNSLAYLQAALFSSLYAIWYLPETIFIRNLLIILGSLIGVYSIIKNIELFKNYRAIPIYIIGLFFLWAIVHIIVIGVDIKNQLHELKSIWLRAGLLSIFGVGFGILLNKCSNIKIPHRIIYVGLLMPTFIFYIKISLAGVGDYYGIKMPEYLLLVDQGSKFFIHKTSYLFFSIPAYIASLCIISSKIKNNQNKTSLIYIIPIIIILEMYFLINSRSGILYGIIFTIIFIINLLLNTKKNQYRNIKLYLTIILTIVLFYFVNFNYKNNGWERFIPDAKVAIQIEKYQQWKNIENSGGLKNENGQYLNTASNYERISWAIVGLHLIKENPLGYGLIERSFGRLAQTKWPESRLTQAHSGWIDLTMGIGVPGVLMLLLTSTIILYNKKYIPQANQFVAINILIGILTIFIGTELSQKIFFESLIFTIVFVASLELRLLDQKNV